MITLNEGIDTARLIEQVIIPAGYHCALGGSVLHKGASNKDLDIFIYPRNGKKLNPALVRQKLLIAGFDLKKESSLSEYIYDSKTIEVWSYCGQRIDIFFVQ